MRVPVNMSGHFRSLWTQSGGSLVPTTVTSQRKSRARAKESAKREQMARDIEALCGSRPEMIARSLDGVERRWKGVKSHGAD
jgi:hypothetical protein